MKQQIASIQIGLPQSLGVEDAPNPMERPWSTGFFKEPIKEAIWLGRTNLVGDGQADLNHHGGREKAVLAYSATHYPYWRKTLNLPDLPCGAFGENFTVVGQTEASVCVGDIYAVGDAWVQVSQPRQPCWKLSRRWQILDLARQVQAVGRTGWYFRVLQEGKVEPGLELILRDRPYAQWTIERANSIMHHELNNREAAAGLANCSLLAPRWRQTLLRRVTENAKVDSKNRLEGKNNS